jgi:hypothetical protein
LMKKQKAAANPDAYLLELDGWRKSLVEELRNEVRASARFDEQIKWGHLVYLHNGPVLLIRAEEARVLFGFWRGQRLREIEPRLKPGGKYEMATMELRDGDSVSRGRIRRLVREAVRLNQKLGDPSDISR